jgi:hypothetical protein
MTLPFIMHRHMGMNDSLCCSLSSVIVMTVCYLIISDSHPLGMYTIAKWRVPRWMLRPFLFYRNGYLFVVDQCRQPTLWSLSYAPSTWIKNKHQHLWTPLPSLPLNW